MRRRDPKLARSAAKTAATIKQAKAGAIVREHGTEGEKASLLFSTLRGGKHKLTDLAAAAEGGLPVEFGPPDPELLATLTRRAERRSQLKLPKQECAADPAARSCRCLERALDQPGDDDKRAVLKLAAAFHKRKQPPKPTPPPQEILAAPQEATESVEDLSPEPAPTPKPEPPARVVHRTRRWYDDSERPRFSETKF